MKIFIFTKHLTINVTGMGAVEDTADAPQPPDIDDVTDVSNPIYKGIDLSKRPGLLKKIRNILMK